MGSIPGLEQFPGEGNGNPPQYSCLEDSMDRGAWLATVHAVAKNRTQLGTHASHSLSLRRRSKETPECTAGGRLQRALLPKGALLPGLPRVPLGCSQDADSSGLLGSEGRSSTKPDRSLTSIVERMGRACPSQPSSPLLSPCELFPLMALVPWPRAQAL